MSPVPLILASASPSRRQMLLNAGLDFEIEPSGVDEDEVKRSLLGERASARDIAATLAYADAAWVATERKRPAERWTLGRQAEVLASSPLLSPAQRDNIMQRFVHADAEVAVQSTR